MSIHARKVYHVMFTATKPHLPFFISYPVVGIHVDYGL